MNGSISNSILLRLSRLALIIVLLTICCYKVQSQMATEESQYKNVVRYNISSALVFGVDRCVIFGYERVIRSNQTISINFGRIKLPKFISIVTDSLELSKDVKSSGYNASIDYRFYLKKENKYPAPHGVYIGPYYSFNRFNRSNRWDFTNPDTDNFIDTDSHFTIHTVGFQVGYQFIVWKRFAIDLCMVGPGLGFYNYEVNFDSTIDPAVRDQLAEGLQQLLTQKFPGMNYTFADKSIDAEGVMRTTTLGYRFLIHIGFVF